MLNNNLQSNKFLYFSNVLFVLLWVCIYFLKTTHVTHDVQKFNLEYEIPLKFANWEAMDTSPQLLVNPELQQVIDSTYSSTLSRVYKNKETGYTVMLSIAYGADQNSESTQAHRPEFCYNSQGFNLSHAVDREIIINKNTKLPLRNIVANKNQRNEPISYWITISNKTTLPGIYRKLNQFYSILNGSQPDGFIVRVSSLDANNQQAFKVQESFISDLQMNSSALINKKMFGIINE